MRNRIVVGLAVCILALAHGGCIKKTAVSARPPAPDKTTAPSASSLSEYIRTVMRVSTENSEANASAVERLHKEDPSIAELARHVEANPSDVEALRQLADAYLDHRLYMSAFQLYQAIRLRVPADAAADIGMARVWDEWRDFDLAIEHANRAVALDPGSALALETQGRVHLHRNEIDLALSSFLAALMVSPDNAALLANAGYAFLLKQDWEKARGHLERAVEIDGTIAQARNHLGIVLSHLGDREGALHQFLAANAPAAAHNDLGATDLAEHRYKEARAEFQEALTIDPGYLLAAQNLKEVEVRLAPPPAYTIPAFAIPGPQAASGAGQSFSDALAENYLPRPPMPLSEHIRRAFLLQEDAAKSAQQARLDAVQPRLAGAWIEAQVPSPTVYAVQIFASRNPQAAQAGAESFAEKSGMTPSIERADLESKGTWFRARINGFESLSAALRAAKRLILAGLISEYWVTPVSE